MQWQSDGELDQADVFALVCRLKQVEDQSHANELWQLGHKYPRSSRHSGRPASAQES